MEDFVCSKFGAEAGDAEVVVAPNKPIWHLVPLPLSQICPTALHPVSIIGQVPSLRSSCLTAISRNLHHYDRESFQGVPAVLIQRILARVRADRGYEDDLADRVISNPDEATVWALSVLLDPEGTESDFTLGVSNISVLQHLTPNKLLAHPEHPLVQLPKLYASLRPLPAISLLTTLNLDAMDAVVNDDNIQSLKWCTNLTALWMKGCHITDTGVRLLASSLELPGDKGDDAGRGMWRLRAWSVSGCKGISDRSMKVFARWPGLVMLDVRNTSCTTSSIDIFNRTLLNIFSGLNANFQPCTDGLLRLFAQNCSSAETLDALRLSLLKESSVTSASPREDGRTHIALHVVPSCRTMRANWLPNPPMPEGSKRIPSRWTMDKDKTTVYRSNGVGQIYGASVGNVFDDAKDFRARLGTYEKMSNKRFQADYEAAAYDAMSSVDKGKYTRRKNKQLKEEQNWKSDKSEKVPLKAGKVVKRAHNEAADEKSKAFVKGAKSGVAAGNEEGTDGDRKLMLVRMVNEKWYELTWTTNTGSTESTGSKTLEGMWGRAAAQRVKAGNLVEELLGSTQVSKPSSQSFSPAPLSRPVSRPPPTPTSSTPASSNPFSSPLSASQSQVPRNPFRSQTSTANPAGVRPLSASQPSQTPSSPSIKPLSSSPFSFSTFSRPPSSQTDESEVKADRAGDGLSFAATGRKRAFDGSSGSGEVKRRGMKMFSVGSGRV